MARPRNAQREHWPRYLYKDGGYFSYRNPISGVRHGVGSDEEEAITIVRKANELLQVEEVIKLPHAARRAAYSDAVLSARLSNVDAPPVVRAVLPQIFRDRPKALALRRLDSWSALMDQRRQRARMPVDVRPLRKGSRPDWLHTLLRHAKQRSYKRKINCCLTIDELAQLVIKSGGYCTVSGVRLRHDSVETGRRPWAPSIDRIDCGLGYTLANCRIVCIAANFAMNEWGESALIEMAMGIAQRQLNAAKPE